PEDHWYVVGLDTTDRYPMFPAAGVGRISATTPAEAAAVVDKVIAYQHPTAADTWRSRNLYVADDIWSNGLSISNDFLVRNDFTEIAFRRISETLARMVSQTAGFSAFGTDSFYLADYTDTVHTCDVAGDSTRRGYFCMAQYGHNYIAPLLWNKMGQGDLIVNYQGHANSQLWAHENILVAGDELNIGNQDRPFLLVSFACHVNKYDYYRENDPVYGANGDGDGLGERLVKQPRTGAVGSFASTCFEWLPYGSEPDLNYELFRSFFVSPPLPDVGGDNGVKWVLGDVLRAAKINFLFRYMGAPTDTNYVWLEWGGYDQKPPILPGNANPYEVFSYCLLGDPALRMDPGPAFFSLFQNGSPVDAYAYFRTAGPDTVTLSARAVSPVGLDSLWVEERASTGAVRPVPASAVTVTSQGDTTAAHARRFQLSYRTAPRFEDYFVDFKARNVDGVVATSSLRRVLALGDFVSDKGPLDPGHVLPADQTIQIRLDTSTPVDSSRFAFQVNGHPAAPTGLLQVVDPDASGGLRHWTVSLHQAFPAGLVNLGFTATSALGGSVSKTVQFQVASGGEFTLGEVINYPNPFEATTSFHYSLTTAVDELTVRIYTVSGRVVREIRAAPNPGLGGSPLDAGTHLLAWDGRDGDGDALANGVYLFKLTARSGGRTLEKMGKMIKVQ
ncbi:MAG TPA: C25 family cysteine peptidase, partial [Candidatus Saccharimonadales bacterium]|nr:C25 family cysteine peptidase [Candidatus Saccharimonadales bacterium]